METSPPPVKKLRAMQLTECVREFTLPQQFPSMITSKGKSVVLKSKNNINESNITNITKISNMSHLATTKSVQLLPSTNPQAGNNLQKLRIKLPNGKDLGEVNVQLLSQKSNILTSKSIFIKQEAFKNVNKHFAWPVRNAEDNITMVPCQTQLETVKQITEKHIDENRIMINISNPLKIQKDDAENKGKIMRNKPLILARKGKSVSKRIHDSKEDSIYASTTNLQNQQYVVQMKSQIELTSTSNLKNATPKFVKLPAELHALKLFITENSGSNSNAEEPCKVSNIATPDTDTKSVYEQKITNAKPLVITQDRRRLSIGTSSKDTCETSNNSKENKMLQTTSCKENKEMPLTTSNNTVNINMDREQNVEQSNTSLNQNSTDLLSANNGMPQKAANSATVNKGKLGKNVMVMVHDNRSDLFQRDNVCLQNSSQNNTRKTVTCPPCKRLENNSMAKDEEMITCNENINNHQLQETQSHQEKQDEGSNSVPSFRRESSEEELIQRRNILEKALNSVQDEELRMQALKALAACGIITERYVPKQPPLDKKLVHDTEVQTVIFGILEKDSFISVSEKEPNIRRIPLKEQPVANFGIDSHCEPLIRDTFVPDQDADDLTDCLNILAKDFLKDNEGACQIKNVLTKPNRKTLNIASQLQKDFETALQYDDEGMLNIHKAVRDSRVQDVRRHLMILKGLKESIDIRTEDGMTSLELALTNHASSTDTDTIHLLLEAGAQPALEETAHDSAILIASKKRSPLLPLLLRYVTNKRSLDMLDSVGFSALHYCAQDGNLEGVKALICGGADVNVKDGRSGRTALFHAVERKRFTVAQKLLDNGAIANIPNFSGQTVLSLVDEIKSLSFRASLNKAVK